jgi:hypothetical protein
VRESTDWWLCEGGTPKSTRPTARGRELALHARQPTNVCGGIFELWRIPGKEYDVDKFMKILDGFNNKVFDKKPSENVSSAEVMDYLRSTDHQFDDLLFWRN